MGFNRPFYVKRFPPPAQRHTLGWVTGALVITGIGIVGGFVLVAFYLAVSVFAPH